MSTLFPWRVAAIVAVTAAIFAIALAQRVQASGATAPSAIIVDAPLQTSAGAKVRSLDLFKAKRATILSLTYLSCRSVCPTSDLVMLDVEERLSRAENKANIGLLTLTVDPFNDTSSGLSKRAADIGSGPHRIWLTGEPTHVFRVLDGLGVSFGMVDDHPSAFFVIRNGGRDIERIDGTPDAAVLLEMAMK